MYSPIIKVEDDRLYVGSSQDCTAIIERTQELHNTGAFGSKDFKHAATIPFVVFETYANTRGLEVSEVLDDPKHLRHMLNDSALSRLRVWKGVV